MTKLDDANGFVRGAVVLLILIIVLGVLYLTRRRSLDVSEAGKTVVSDLEQAAESVRDTSEDALLTAKVKAALGLSKSSSAFDVDVDSDEGKVTLTGSVASEEARKAVLDIARDTEGVLSVVDRLQIDSSAGSATTEKVLGERLAELQIESAVYERLLHAETVDARRIRVLVDGGTVRLTGSVPDAQQKARAAALVASVAGVENVVNDLEIVDRTAGLSLRSPAE
jgi:osmotically-inducible protein OsmY